MLLLPHRTVLRRRLLNFAISSLEANFHHAPYLQKNTYGPEDPRLHLIHDEFATLRSSYEVPKHPIVLAHGVLGFDELRLAGPSLPAIQYWYGISEALRAKGCEVITASVPPSGSIERRAEKLAEGIERQGMGRSVNIIAYVRNCCWNNKRLKLMMF